MTSAALLLLALPASAQIWDVASLGRLFDGSQPRPDLPAAALSEGSQWQERFVIRAEDDPLPRAPRFAVDLSAIPPEYRHMVSGFERLPHKNQEETPEFVSRMNALIRERNRGRRFGKVKEWSYDGRTNEPPWTCLAHAAASANDWWALQLGRELPSHVSRSHGGAERGLDPNLLELEYFRRAKLGRPGFVLIPKFVEEDPVRHTTYPYDPRGYAELLVEDEPYQVEDPITQERLGWKPADSAMEGEYIELFAGNLLQERTPDRYAKVLAQALDRWGAAVIQTEHVDRPRWPGAHTVLAVGYFCLEAPQRLIHCSDNRTDADWARTAYFVAHDSFGDFPAAKVRDASGGSAYRAVRITSIDQALVFPHGLLVSAEPRPEAPGAWRVRVANRGGRPVQVLRLKAKDEQGRDVSVGAEIDGSYYVQDRPGQKLVLLVEAQHYFDRDGRGRRFLLTLEPGKASLGLPTRRPF